MDHLRLSRRRLLILSAAGAIAVSGTRRQAGGADSPQVKPKIEGDTAWHDVAAWGVEGKGWPDTQRYYDRLPARAKDTVSASVWEMSRHSSGMFCRFETSATTISARWEVLSKNIALPEMPASGASGLDLYAQVEPGKWWWLAATRPAGGPSFTAVLVKEIAPGPPRAYMLYLPVYNGIESLEIGVPAAADFRPIAPRTTRPIIYYGTSIAHGACASRPGMAFVSILGRKLNRPMINMGLSGTGTMDPEVGHLLSELDAAVYVIDCLPNMNGPMVAARTEPLVRILREARAATPIVLVEDRTSPSAYLIPSTQQHHATSRAALRAAYDRLVTAGVKGLHYVEGDHLLGDDHEATVDGSHPTDLGMMRMANAMERVLRPILPQE